MFVQDQVHSQKLCLRLRLREKLDGDVLVQEQEDERKQALGQLSTKRYNQGISISIDKQ